MPESKDKVLIAIPTGGGVHEQTAMWVSKVAKCRNNFIPATFRGRPTDYSRNAMVRIFLSDESLTHLLFIDSDMEPPIDAVDRLLSRRMPIVAGCYPVTMSDGLNWALSIKGDDGHHHLIKQLPDKDNLFPVDGAGAGCLMIRREVLAQLPWPWFRWIERPDGSQVSEDIFFCDKAIAAGWPIYADPQVICYHYKTLNVPTLKQSLERQIATAIAKER